VQDKGQLEADEGPSCFPCICNGRIGGDPMKNARLVIPAPMGLSGWIWANIRCVSWRDLCGSDSVWDSVL